MPSTLAGRAWCEDEHTGVACDQHYVEFNGVLLAGATDGELWAVACHETGHTLGLLHGNQNDPPVPGNHPDLSCMQHAVSLAQLPNMVGGANVAFVNQHY